jgi:lysophospholipase L1-like esterase
MPPIKDFPAFSYPLKITLGNLTELLGKRLKAYTSKTRGVFFNHKIIHTADWINKYEEINKNELFSDGVHPSQITYQIWAKDFASYLLSNQQIKSAILKQPH